MAEILLDGTLVHYNQKHSGKKDRSVFVPSHRPSTKVGTTLLLVEVVVVLVSIGVDICSRASPHMFDEYIRYSADPPLGNPITICKLISKDRLWVILHKGNF